MGTDRLPGANLDPHLWLNTGRSWGARPQPQRAVVTQPRPNGLARNCRSSGFAKALKGRDQSTEQGSQACSRKAYFALSGLNANRRTDSRTQAALAWAVLAPPLWGSARRCRRCPAKDVRHTLHTSLRPLFLLFSSAGFSPRVILAPRL